jgi:DNA polymerase
MRLPSGRRLSYYQPRIEWDMKACPKCQFQECPAPDCKTAFICSTCDGEGRVRVRTKGGCNACGGTGKVKDDFSVRVTYMGIDTKTRQWTRVSSYGGKWTENAVQAASRDLLVNGMFAVEERGWPIVMTVHDEVVLEVDKGTVSVEDAEKVLCVLPRWAEGLPVAAEGWCGYRYRK